jgi:hypothetical protein
VCCDPYREKQINALHQVQKKAAKFAHHKDDSDWKTFAQCRKTDGTYALFKVYI